ncbi:MAG: terminase small subunit [Planctomycetota bacterium]|jgi:phage terminase small subunit
MLNQQQDAFCVHYTTIGSDTYGHGTKSAKAAGYSEKTAYSQATRLLKKAEIRQRISALHAENMQRNYLTIEKVLDDLEHEKLLARQEGQHSVATKCSELQGKYLAMFTDKSVNMNTNMDIPVDAKELLEWHKAEVERLEAATKVSKQLDSVSCAIARSSG